MYASKTFTVSEYHKKQGQDSHGNWISKTEVQYQVLCPAVDSFQSAVSTHVVLIKRRPKGSNGKTDYLTIENI